MIYDENGKVLQENEVDLSKGNLIKKIRIRKDAIPVDDKTKFAWDDEDYEEVQVYILFTEEQLLQIENQNKPSQLDRIEAQVAYTAMLTDTLMEG